MEVLFYKAVHLGRGFEGMVHLFIQLLPSLHCMSDSRKFYLISHRARRGFGGVYDALRRLRIYFFFSLNVEGSIKRRM